MPSITKRKTIIVVLTIVILGVIAVVALSSQPQDQSVIPQNTSLAESDIETCQDEECFEEKFSDCQPSRYEVSEGPETAEYEILGSKEPRCSISVKYINSENEQFIDKGMTCDFDNSIDLESSARLVYLSPSDYGCEGELLEYL